MLCVCCGLWCSSHREGPGWRGHVLISRFVFLHYFCFSIFPEHSGTFRPKLNKFSERNCAKISTCLSANRTNRLCANKVTCHFPCASSSTLRLFVTNRRRSVVLKSENHLVGCCFWLFRPDRRFTAADNISSLLNQNGYFWGKWTTNRLWPLLRN